MTPIDYALLGFVALLVVTNITQMFWNHSSGNERDHLSDLLNDALKREDTLTDDRDGFKVDNDRLRPALATSERLLIEANAVISKLRDEAATKAKERIDAVPDSDLVSLSHQLLSPSTAADPAAPGDDHDPGDAVPHPSPASER